MNHSQGQRGRKVPDTSLHYLPPTKIRASCIIRETIRGFWKFQSHTKKQLQKKNRRQSWNRINEGLQTMRERRKILCNQNHHHQVRVSSQNAKTTYTIKDTTNLLEGMNHVNRMKQFGVIDVPECMYMVKLVQSSACHGQKR